MINGRIQKIGEAYAVILDENARESLGVAEGDVVFISAGAEETDPSGFDPAVREQIKVGEAFMEEYDQTYRALAQ